MAYAIQSSTGLWWSGVVWGPEQDRLTFPANQLPESAGGMCLRRGMYFSPGDYLVPTAQLVEV